MADVDTDGDGTSTSGCCGSRLPRRCRTCMGDRRCEPISSWIILAAAFGTNFILSIPDISFGIFYDHFQEKYQTTKAAIGWIFFVFAISGSVLVLLVSPFVVLYGCRVVAIVSSVIYALGMCLTAWASTLPWCIVCFGFIGGVGYGGIFLVSMTIIQQCFPYNRGMATGISTLGFTVGIILSPVLIELFFENYGFSGALVLHGALYVQGIVFAALLKSPAKYIQMARSKMETEQMLKKNTEKDCDETELNSDAEGGKAANVAAAAKGKRPGIKDIFKNMMDFSAFRNILFVLCIFHIFLFMVSRFGFQAHIVSAAVHQGVSPPDAGYLFTIMGICNMVIRLVSIVIMNFRKVNPLLFTSVGTLFLALSGLVAAFATSYGTFVLAMILNGCYGGITNTVLPMVVVYIVGVEKFPRSFSILKVCNIPAPLLGAPFAGWMFDITKEYTVSFVVIGLSAVLSTILAVTIWIMMRLRYKRPGKEDGNPQTSKRDGTDDDQLEDQPQTRDA